MDDMTAFDRLLTSEVRREAGPSQPVNDAAIFTAITATQSPKWRFGSMFSALKFLVAGAIVALFGGFLLAGLLAQPSDDRLPAVGASASATAQAEPTDAATSEPEPTTGVEADDSSTPALLPGVDLVTEEVEPGVYRVLSDGAGHDLVAEPPGALILDSGGDLVLFSGPQPYALVPLDRFYTLGVPGDQSLDRADGSPPWLDAVIDDDGNLRTPLTWPNGSTTVSAVEVGPDGAVWATRNSTGPWPRVARIEDGVWTVLPMIDDGTKGHYLGAPENFAVAPDGTVWFASNDGSGDDLPKGTKRLLHFDGEQWLEPDVPIDPSVRQFGPLAIGPDGTLWVYATTAPFDGEPHYLLRLRHEEWTVFSEADGVPLLVGAQVFGANLAVDTDGTLWIAFDGDSPIYPETLPPPLGPSDPPHGVLSFDGSTWRQYLGGHQVNRLEVAEDGSVWATSLRDCTEVPKEQCVQHGGDGLYVITPEAVAE